MFVNIATKSMFTIFYTTPMHCSLKIYIVYAKKSYCLHNIGKTAGKTRTIFRVVVLNSLCTYRNRRLRWAMDTFTHICVNRWM